MILTILLLFWSWYGPLAFQYHCYISICSTRGPKKRKTTKILSASLGLETPYHWNLILRFKQTLCFSDNSFQRQQIWYKCHSMQNRRFPSVTTAARIQRRLLVQTTAESHTSHLAKSCKRKCYELCF